MENHAAYYAHVPLPPKAVEAQPLPASMTARERVRRFVGPVGETAYDDLAVEEPLQIRLAGEDVAVTMRTPGHDFELAAGFLYTEGIIARNGDIARIEYCTDTGVTQEYNIVSTVLRPDVEFRADRLTRHFYMTSSCRVCGQTALEAV